MSKIFIDFRYISDELERIHSLREQTTLAAFGALGRSYSIPADFLISEFRDLSRAAHWM